MPAPRAEVEPGFTYWASGHSALVGGDFYDVHAGTDPAAETVVVLDLLAEQLNDFPRARRIVAAAEHSRTQGA